MYVIQHCFIWRPSDFTVSDGCWNRTQDCCDFGIDSQTLKTTSLDLIHTWLDLIHKWLDLMGILTRSIPGQEEFNQ